MSLIFCAAFLQVALLAADPATTPKTETAAPKTATVIAKTEKAPAKTETADSKTEKVPAKTETAPKTETSAKDQDKDTAKKTEAEETYAEAHRLTLKTGKPLVVMVGADWCVPCQNMRKTILPRVREHGLFRRVTFAHVNVDREKDLAAQLTGGGASVPQLIMYRKTKDGWMRRKMVGGHTVEEVEQFINEGLAMDDEEHNAEAQASHDKPDAHGDTGVDQPGDDKRHG